MSLAAPPSPVESAAPAAIAPQRTLPGPPPSAPPRDPFFVSLNDHLLESAVHAWPALGRWLGNWESRWLRAELDATPIDRPLFVAGLARSGTTIVLELLAAHGDAASHRYSDFPLIFTPYWSQSLQRHAAAGAPVERAHGDGLLVTPASPEAMEEPLWMAFFPRRHDPHVNQVLDASVEHPAFEQFYRDHLRKVLRLRGGARYVSKGNYNLVRLAYLQRLFPDLRAVAPIRDPLTHIASLMKQHRLFTAGQLQHPRARAHLRRVGHFEFGCDRRPIHVGRRDVVDEVLALWERGEEVRGWARWLHDRLQADPALRAATLVVRYEDLCRRGPETVDRLLQHMELPPDAGTAAVAAGLHEPTYYRPEFTDEEQAIIHDETARVARKFGYR
jgi:hypothetical protein